MFRLASIASGAAGGQFPSIKLVNFAAGLMCAAVALRVTYPVTVTANIMTASPTVNQIAQAALGNMVVRYGEQGQFVPYSAVSGGDLQVIDQGVLRMGAPNNILPNGSYAIGNYNIYVDLFVPFFTPALSDGRDRLPGWSQMRTLEINVTEGAALNYTSVGTLARQTGANVQIDVDTLTFPAKKDQWSSVLSYAKVNQNNFNAIGPNGLHYMAWDANAAFASTALQLYSLSVGDQKLADTIPPYIADDRYQDFYVEGTPGVIDAAYQGTSGATVLLSPEAAMHSKDLPHGVLSVNQPNMYVAQLQLRCLYWPDISQEESGHAATVMSKHANAPILLHTIAAAEAPGVSIGHTASLPVQASTPKDDDFTLKPGLIVSAPGATPKLSIPAHITQSLQAAVRAVAPSGAATVEAAKSKVMANLALRIPGLHSEIAQRGNAGIANAHGLGGMFSNIFRDFRI